ncbi:secreted protein [Chitinophaga niastensis]|uniref:Alpha-galactosidase n=1 Tax=Chitinophaga niastensis TaxID=536980 RepID=A0A2P8HA47_CHINA|nr:twin-arginine translocation signal domain-containing protein [Chitinophaga niastensis]PSL43071.1 secreted protein [Chitinophaga niastensis]
MDSRRDFIKKSALLAGAAGLSGMLPFSVQKAFADRGNPLLASVPPMGWNTYDCFQGAANEDIIKQIADYMVSSGMKDAGYVYVILDAEWYQDNTTRTNAWDKYGRLIPDITKFPSSANGNGFKPLADYIHSKGLKFGFHIFRGMFKDIYNANPPVKGTTYHTKNVTDTSNVSSWCIYNYGLNMKHPGAQAYIDAQFELYNQWGIDFLKIDDLVDPYESLEVSGYHTGRAKLKRPILISGSPGGGPNLQHAANLQNNMEMWRVTSDVWDHWNDIYKQFDSARDWAPYTKNGTWADLDMLPFGQLRDNWGPDPGKVIWTKLTNDEVKTCMTLHCISRSPLIMGGDVRANDAFTLDVLINRDALDANKNGSKQREIYGDASTRKWISTVHGTNIKYLAIFNTGLTSRVIDQGLVDIGFPEGALVKDIWNKSESGKITGTFSPTIPAHGVGFYKLDSPDI